MGGRILALGLAISLAVVLAVAWSPTPLVSSITGVAPVLADTGPLPPTDIAPETTTMGGDERGAVPLVVFAIIAAVALAVSLSYLARVERRREG